MITQEVKDIAAKIGKFYLQKNNGDYQNTQKEIESLRINCIEVVKQFIIIELSRPGILIGRKGENVEKLEQFLGLKIHITETTQSLLDYLVPVEFNFY